jgi:hypothetical protein
LWQRHFSILLGNGSSVLPVRQGTVTAKTGMRGDLFRLRQPGPVPATHGWLRPVISSSFADDGGGRAIIVGLRPWLKVSGPDFHKRFQRYAHSSAVGTLDLRFE